MPRIYPILLCWIFWQPFSAQNANDQCENATDITSEIFNFEDWDYCNSVNGTIHNGFGRVIDHVDHPTVDALVYQSQDCLGYAPETTDHFPDLWYKTTLHEERTIRYQTVFINIGDTVQVAVYYGQCGALYQSQCFTLTYADSMLWQGVSIEYYPHKAEDDMYIQIKVPPHYQGYTELCFSDGTIGFIYYNFKYDRPAGTGGISNVTAASLPVPISLYPNPSNDWLTVRSDAPILSYTISDLQGIAWRSGKNLENQASLPMTELPSGIYVITVLTQNGMGMSKFCKL